MWPDGTAVGAFGVQAASERGRPRMLRHCTGPELGLSPNLAAGSWEHVCTSHVFAPKSRRFRMAPRVFGRLSGSGPPRQRGRCIFLSRKLSARLRALGGGSGTRLLL